MAEKKVIVLNPVTGELQQHKAGDTVFGLTPNQVAATAAALAAETTARIAADSTLTTDLAAEVTNRQAAIVTVQANIDAEVTARTAAQGSLASLGTTNKTNLVSAINEVLAATGESGALQQEVNAIETAVGLSITGTYVPTPAAHYTITSSTIAQAIADIDAVLYTEVTGRAAANSAEVTARNAAIAAEATLRTAADDLEITARQAADTTLTNNLAAEVTARTGADATLTSNLNAEITARQAADGNLSTLTTTAKTDLVSAINEVKAAVGASSGGWAGALAAEETARIAADTTLTNNLAAEVTNRQAADTTLTNDLAAEVTARTNADTTLTNNLAAEVTNRTNADTTLQTNITDEASARLAADNAETTARENADALRVLKAGDTMTGNLVFSGTTLPSGLAAPTQPTDATNKAYVDGLVASGTRWVGPVRNPDLVGIASIEPGSPLASGMYVAFGGTYPQTWTNTGNAGTISVSEYDMMHLASGGIWQKSGTLTAGTRLLAGVFTNAIDVAANQNLTGTGIFKDDLVEYLGGNPTLPASWTFPQGRVGAGYTPSTVATATALTKTFVIAGDVTRDFHTGNLAVYSGGSASNGTYTVVSATFGGGNTSVVVFETVAADATGGTLDAELRDGVTTLTNNTSDSHFGQSYLYSGTANEWVQISGPGVVDAGVGLYYTGTTLNVGLGAGIKQSPSDEVGIDLFNEVTGSALILTNDGSTRANPEESNSSLHLLLAANSALSQAGTAGLTLVLDEVVAGASGLTLGAGGLKIAAGKVTNAMLTNSTITMAGATGTKVTDLGGTFSILGDNAQGIRTSIVGNDLVITADNATSTTKGVAQYGADFTVSAGAVALSTTGVSAGAFGSATAIPVVTVDSKGRVTALSTVAINTSASTTAVTTTGSVVGDAVYVSASGVVTKAQANAAGTVKVAGFVTATGEIATSGTVSGLSGLTPGDRYFLSEATAGAITNVAPSTGYIAPVGIAVTGSTLAVQIGMPIEL